MEAIRIPEDDWDRHWDDYADAAQRNPAQQYRRRLAMSLLERDGPPSRLLDIGSGQGDLLAAAAERWPAAQLVGAEISAGGVEISQRKLPTGEFHVVDLVTTEQPPPQRAGWATHAVCSEVLEHVDEPVTLMRNARSWLAPGCRVVVTVPGGPMSAFDRHIGHRRHFTPVDLAALLGRAGFEVESSTGAGFPFFNVYRATVIARGDRLVSDVAAGPQGASTGRAAMLAMDAFRVLFRLNLPRTAFGWQTVAVARTPDC